MPKKLSRYQRVQLILNQAAGDSAATYQGYGRFWETLSLAELLRVEIYGVRMIAPAAGDRDETADGGSCCGGAATPEPPTTPVEPQPGRGAASGLVRGLRGEFPFDGSEFSRLPFGGKPVAAKDIRFIEQWIDDGCPEVDTPRPRVAASGSTMAARAAGDEEHPLCPMPVNDIRRAGNGPMVRKNIACLTPEELARLRNGLAVMRSFDAYLQDDRSFAFWARIHANGCEHGWEEFLPWHRAYLYEFEQRLQDIDPRITLPYWDWTAFYEHNSNVQKLDTGRIPRAYRCWLDEKSVDPDDPASLANNPDVAPGVVAKLASFIGPQHAEDSGSRFLKQAGITPGEDGASDAAIYAQLLRVNQLWHQKRWPGPGGSGLNFEDYPTPSDIENILQIPGFFTFGSGPGDNHFFGACENIHNLLHNFSGGADPENPSSVGDMVDPRVTAFDPIFWGHHSNVDRLWAEWQDKHPGQGPDNLGAVLAPWSYTVGQTLSYHAFGYEYMLCSSHFETASEMPMQRFRSAKAQVDPYAMRQHSRAEIRVHNLCLTGRGGVIRAFLNAPDADETTPMRGNDHYVGQHYAFIGPCVGGPGHCDLPAKSDRPNDRRKRAHKTAGVVRFDATDAVAKLRRAGHEDFDVHLVMMGVGGGRDDVCRMDGVSLNFFD